MTDNTFFESHSDDANEQSPGLQGRFACIRRFIDLTHIDDLSTVDLDEAARQIEDSQDSPDHAVAHVEIVELIEELLDADPLLQPGREIHPCCRPHTVHLPEQYEPGYAYPLIIWFHDDGGSEQELAQVMPVISERNYIGAALQGNVSVGSGFGWSAEATLSTELLNDVRRLAMSLRREYHIHSERIYLAGFGAGATTAVRLMLARPEWFGGVISLSGTVPTPEGETSLADELKDKRILLATSLGSRTPRVGDVVAAGRMLYSAGMKVGTRIYQDSTNAPTRKMLRDLDNWLMDDICCSSLLLRD